MATAGELREHFIELRERGRLSHAYALFGEHEAASEAFLRAFGYFLETGSWEAGTRPLSDALSIDGAESGIAAARAFSKFLWQKPVVSTHRFACITGADRLTAHAEQAILKVVEEPPEHALIAFSLRSPERLIPALASRVQKFFFVTPEPRAAGEATLVRTAQGLLSARTNAEKKELIKTAIETEASVDGIMSEALVLLGSDLPKHWRRARVILERLAYVSQFSTNRRLQLEAAFFTS